MFRSFKEWALSTTFWSLIIITGFAAFAFKGIQRDDASPAPTVNEVAAAPTLPE